VSKRLLGELEFIKATFMEDSCKYRQLCKCALLVYPNSIKHSRMHANGTHNAQNICWALPPPNRVAWPCERLPFWYMPMWLWRQDTRLNMFICHTQRPSGSLNLWRVTWDQRL